MAMSQNSGPKLSILPKTLWNALSYIAGFNLYSRSRNATLEEPLSSLTLIQQWDQDRDLFVVNFNALKEGNNFLKHCMTRVSYNRFLLSVFDVLMGSAEQQFALPFIMDIIRAKVKESENMGMDTEQFLLVFIRIAIERHNALLANHLLLEWPNTDIDRAHLRNGNTLLMHFIEKGNVEEIQILLGLKNINSEYCVNPNGPTPPLKKAKDLHKPEIVALLKEYGARDYDNEDDQKRRCLLESSLQEAQVPTRTVPAAVLNEWEGPLNCIKDEHEEESDEKTALLHRA